MAIPMTFAANFVVLRVGSARLASARALAKGSGGWRKRSSDAGGWCAGEPADPHEREGLTMRTAQMPRWRGRGARSDEDDDGEQGLDHRPACLGGRVHPAEIAHAVLAAWQHVLQIPAHELGGSER